MSVTADTKLKDRLKEIEAKIADVRDRRAAAAKERDAARAAYAGMKDISPGSPEFKAAKEAVRAVGALDDELAAYTAEQVEVLRMISGGQYGAAGSSNGDGDGAAQSGAWSSRDLLASSDTRQRLAEMSSTSIPVGRANLGYLADREALAATFGTQTFGADVGGTSNMRRGEYLGVVPQLSRPLRILDLIPTGTTDSNVIPYTQESGTFAGAAETAEGTLKPEAAVTFTDAEARAATIAAWTKTRKQVLADVPGLQSVLDNRLRYGVERRLQDQIVAGDGVGENIRGILNTTGINTIVYDANQLVADQVLRGITSVLLSDADADAILMHPTDWQTALITKAADGHYYSGGPFSPTAQSMWGVPLIPNAAIPAGMALVGSFALGVQLFIREGVLLLISDSDGNDFTYNRVTLLAEMRAALAVWRPAAFTTVDLAL